MTNNFRILSIAIILILTLGIAMPQPAHAGFVGSMVSGAVNSVKGAVSGVVDTVKGAVGGVVDTFKGAVSGAINATKEVFNQVKDTVKGVVGSFMGTGNAIAGAVGQAAGSVSSAVSGAVGAATGAAGGAMDMLKGIGEKAMGAIGGFQSTIDAVKGIMADKSLNLIDKVKNSITQFKTDLGGNLGDISDLIADGKNKLLDGLKDPSSLLGPVLGEVTKNPVIEELMNVGKGLAAKGTEMFASITEKGSEYLNKAKEFGGNVLTAAGEAVSKNDFLQKTAAYSNKLSEMVSAKADAVQFNKQYGELFNNKVDANGVKGSSMMSFAGLDISTKDNVHDRANAIPGATNLTTKVDGHLGLKLDASISKTGENYSVSAATRNVVGLSAYGEGSLKWMEGGTLASASGNAQVAAGVVSSNELSGKVNLSENFGAKADVQINGLAGADASVKGNAYIGRNGIELKGGAEARAGLWADAAGSTGVQYKGQNLFTASGTAGAGLGVGAGVKGGAAFRLDKVGFDASVTLGPVKLGGGIYVNPQAVAQLGFDKGKQAVNAVGNGLKSAGGWVKSWFD